MRNWTLDHKFRAGLVILVVVMLSVLWGVRLVGVSASFHYLERQHAAALSEIEKGRHLAEIGAVELETLRLSDLIRHAKRAREICDHADTDVFMVEEWAFRLFGFGRVFDLPRENRTLLTRIIGELEAGEVRMTAALATRLKSDITLADKNAGEFGPVLAGAASFARSLTIGITWLCFGALFWMFLTLRRASLGPIARCLSMAREIASGNLAVKVEHQRKDEFGHLLDALADMNASLARIVSQVRNSAESIAHATSEVAMGNADLSMRTEQQASELQRTAASMGELTEQVQVSAQHADHARGLVGVTHGHAQNGGTLVQQAVSSMDSIKAASNRIADITSVIDGIAFQTNILALNAAVEAARAGDHGRGFAVVAAEVRSLAQRSATAAKEIKTLITDSVEKVAAGVGQVHQAGLAMEQIVTSVSEVQSLVSQIAAAGSQQEQGIREVGEAVRRIDTMTQQNAALVEEAAAAAQSMSEQAVQLTNEVSAFRL